MRFIFTTLLALCATTALGQISGLPKCAFSCLTGSYGGCSQYDYKCICGNKSFIASLSCCVAKKCDKKQQDATIQFAVNFCKGAGITTLPTSAVCTSTDAAGKSTTKTAGDTTTTSSGGSSSAATTSSATTAAQSASSSPSATPTPNTGHRNIENYGLGMAVAGLIAAL